MLHSVLVAVLLLFPSIRAKDVTSFHLHNHLNHSVSACSDFYSHVCGSAMYSNQTIPHKSEQYYRKLAEKLGSRSRNNPIMDAISSARSSKACEFEASTYKEDLEYKCGTRFHCYLDEFNYFYETYIIMVEDGVEDTLKHFAVRANKTDLDMLASVTSKLVGVMIERSKEDYDFDSVVSPYESLQDRLFVINAFKKLKNKKKNRIRLKKLRKIEENLREAIADRFMETEWLKETDDFGLERESQFLTTLDEMTIGFDFDEEDSDISAWREMNRHIATKYFEYSKRSTGCKQFDVMHPFLYIKWELENNLESSEAWKTFERFTSGFMFNAHYYSVHNSVILFAPVYFPIVFEHSTSAALHGHAVTIAHEILHAFTESNLAYNSGAFNQEYECYTAHFNASCDVWAPGNCSSGEKTFEEDAPDVEGLRVTFDLLRKIYSDEELQEYEYEDLEITREQAFFYAYAMGFCNGIDSSFDPDDDEHSNDTVRVNGAMAMMPEFSAAFGCEEGDEEYSEKDAVCYLFGPLSGQFEDEEEEAENGGEEERRDTASDDGNDDGAADSENEGTSGNDEDGDSEEETKDEDDEEDEGSTEDMNNTTTEDDEQERVGANSKRQFNNVVEKKEEDVPEEEHSGSGEEPFEKESSDNLLS